MENIVPEIIAKRLSSVKRVLDEEIYVRKSVHDELLKEDGALYAKKLRMFEGGLAKGFLSDLRENQSLMRTNQLEREKSHGFICVLEERQRTLAVLQRLVAFETSDLGKRLPLDVQEMVNAYAILL